MPWKQNNIYSINTNIMKSKNLLIFRIVTGLFTFMILSGVAMYIFDHDTAAGLWEALGYPTYPIYPLAVAKVLGLVAIWTNKSPVLKEWAYAGFVFELLLGIGAHLAVQDGEFGGATLVLVLAIVSYIFDRRVAAEKLQLAA